MEFLTKNEKETERLGEEFARRLRGGDIVAMCGEMGAGKTAFVRGIARGMGSCERVTSPTYTIVNEYFTSPPLFHFDLYRLSSADELYEIGFDDYIARGGICVIEWFENAEGAYKCDFTVNIARASEDDDARIIEISEAGEQ